MRSVLALAGTVLLASLSSLAHADTERTVTLKYAGSVVVNGSSVLGDPNSGVTTYYNDVSVAAAVTLTEDIYQYEGPVFYLTDFTFALPDAVFDTSDFSDPILGQFMCGDDGSLCYQGIGIFFDPTEAALSGFLPTPDLLVQGERNTFVEQFGPDNYLVDDVEFTGTVSLVTTPEPETFALLGTGLLGVGWVLLLRRDRTFCTVMRGG